LHQYKQLNVWQNAVDFAENIYTCTRDFPQEEKFGLIAQIRRAAISIASNIAEGSCRNTAKEFAHFIGVSSGSVAEVETQLIIANRLGFISNETLDSLLEKGTEIMKKLWKLRASLTKNNT